MSVPCASASVGAGVVGWPAWMRAQSHLLDPRTATSVPVLPPCVVGGLHDRRLVRPTSVCARRQPRGTSRQSRRSSTCAAVVAARWCSPSCPSGRWSGGGGGALACVSCVWVWVGGGCKMKLKLTPSLAHRATRTRRSVPSMRDTGSSGTPPALQRTRRTQVRLTHACHGRVMGGHCASPPPHTPHRHHRPQRTPRGAWWANTWR